MNKYTFVKVNENIYYEKLSNGLEVFLYPTKKTKNFYISISVKYGASILKYKKNNKEYDIIPGSAHFLEHKVMALSENKEISKRINSYGSLANAWTNYKGTNYNIFGSINLIENLKILLDIFYNINIDEKNVEEEKGIIGEEIDMYKDQINSFMNEQLLKNMFSNSYVKNTVIGERSDIEKITSESLNRVYNDYYVPNNTFIVVTGDFDKDEVMKVIKDYTLKLKPKELPKEIKTKEKDKVCVAYEEINKDSDNIRVKYAIKINKNNFKVKNDIFLRYYLNIILSNSFSSTSKLYEKYKNEGIIINMSSYSNVLDDHVLLIVSAVCNDGNVFLDNISKDIKNIRMTKDEFERKKKLFLKSYILDFDNIEDIEYNIVDYLLLEGKVNYNEYNDIVNMNYKTAKNVIDSLTFDNISIIRTTK